MSARRSLATSTMATAEHVERQIAVAIVITVKNRPPARRAADHLARIKPVRDRAPPVPALFTGLAIDDASASGSLLVPPSRDIDVDAHAPRADPARRPHRHQSKSLRSVLRGRRSFAKHSAAGQPVLTIYITSIMTARMSARRLPPSRFADGMTPCDMAPTRRRSCRSRASGDRDCILLGSHATTAAGSPISHRRP